MPSFCGNCGSPCSGMFCGGCGMPTGANATVNTPTPQKKTPKSASTSTISKPEKSVFAREQESEAACWGCPLCKRKNNIAEKKCPGCKERRPKSMKPSPLVANTLKATRLPAGVAAAADVNVKRSGALVGPISPKRVKHKRSRKMVAPVIPALAPVVGGAGASVPGRTSTSPAGVGKATGTLKPNPQPKEKKTAPKCKTVAVVKAEAADEPAVAAFRPELTVVRGGGSGAVGGKRARGSAPARVGAAAGAAAANGGGRVEKDAERRRWYCGACGAKNRMSREECRKCSEPQRVPAPPPMGALQAPTTAAAAAAAAAGGGALEMDAVEAMAAAVVEALPADPPAARKRKRMRAGKDRAAPAKAAAASGGRSSDRLMFDSSSDEEDNAPRGNDRGGSTATKKKSKSQSNTFGAVQLCDIWRMTAELKAQLSKQGTYVNVEKWSQLEKDVLSQNILNWIKNNSDEEFKQCLEKSDGSSTDGSRKGFFKLMCKGLDRTVIAVWKQIHRLYNKAEVEGAYSLEDWKAVHRLQKVYGNNWTQIASHLGRTAESVRSLWRYRPRKKIEGPWSKQEDAELQKAVYEVTGSVPGSNIDSGVPWQTIASKIKKTCGRTEFQCSRRWYHNLNWRQRNPGMASWGIVQSLELVQFLYDSGASHVSEIIWRKVARKLNGGTTAKSGQHLKNTWSRLSKTVPDYVLKSFEQLLEAVLIRLRDSIAIPEVSTSDEEYGDAGDEEEPVAKTLPEHPSLI